MTSESGWDGRVFGGLARKPPVVRLSICATATLAVGMVRPEPCASQPSSPAFCT